MLTVIAAMDLELGLLRRAVQAESGGMGGDPSPFGSGLALDLQVIGVGRNRAMARVKELVSSHHRSSGPEDGSGQRFLLLGFAGAVDPSLRPGELSLPAQYYVAQQGNDGLGHFLKPDEKMRRQAEAAAARAGLAVAHGSSLTLDYVAATPEVKAALRREYPVDVVNMEDYWVAEAARDAGVPFLSVRAVLDSADQSLPSSLLALTEHRATAVLGTVGMPWRLATLWRFAQQTLRARRTLTRFALSYIRHERVASSESSGGLTALFSGSVSREAEVR
jgi:nucleoside phosphorylase